MNEYKDRPATATHYNEPFYYRLNGKSVQCFMAGQWRDSLWRLRDLRYHPDFVMLPSLIDWIETEPQWVFKVNSNTYRSAHNATFKEAVIWLADQITDKQAIHGSWELVQVPVDRKHDTQVPVET